MFLIANSCGKEITISDLGVTLSARQAIDLHKINTPISPEKSKDLQKAKHYGAIKILHREEQQKTIIKEREIVIKESFDKEDLLKDIKSILTQEIDKKINSSQNDNSQQMAAILAMMQQFANNGQNTSNVVNEGIEDTDISGNDLVDLHSRSLNKMSKDVVDGKLRGHEEIKSGILNNVDELENML